MKKLIKLKESDIINIVKRVIKEQPVGEYLDNLETVGAKGCCPQLYLFLDFISSHQTNINNIIELMSQLSVDPEMTAQYGIGGMSNEQITIFTDSISSAENAIEEASLLYDTMESTGCCKSLTGKR